MRSVAELAALVGARAGDGRVGDSVLGDSVVGDSVVAGARAGGGRIVVGIAGAPGSGKSTIAAELVALLAPRAVLLPMDGFHLPQARLVELGRRDRMGAPDTFDVAGFVATLAAVRASFGNSGRTVLAPGFDREIEEAVPDAVAILPEFPIVVVEGNYLLLDDGGWQHVAPLLDLTVVVGVDRDIRLSRLIARHERFGKTAAAATEWALGPDERNAEIVAASAGTATHVIALD
nr:nucleoside/nucleotide kinase family protein [Conyzicola lurida]